MRACVVILSALIATTPVAAANKAAPERHHAHRHGAAKLQVSLDAGALQISFEGPADNMLGFEHAPKNEAQKKTLARAEEQLRQPAQLFALPPGAECQAQPAQLDTRLPVAGSGETHSEMQVAWRWDCAKPQALTHVDVGLFKAFPRLKELRVELVTPAGQRTAVLRPAAARLKLVS
jgi:hypothetical protein